MQLENKQKEILLDLAEAAIHHHLDGTIPPPLTEEILDKGISDLSGAFVSVYIKDKLRGCIGTFSESDPLYENIQKMAVSAAFNDNRFDAISRFETEDLKIEISVLTPRQRIFSVEEIEIGRHGIYLISGGQRGTLLPQVAVSNDWMALELLENCAHYKLGIHKSGWKDAEMYTYEAIVFSR